MEKGMGREKREEGKEELRFLVFREKGFSSFRLVG